MTQASQPVTQIINVQTVKDASMDIINMLCIGLLNMMIGLSLKTGI